MFVSKLMLGRPLLLLRPTLTYLPLFNAGNKMQRIKYRIKKYRKEKLATATFNKNEELKKLMEIQNKESNSGKTVKIYEPLEAFEAIEQQFKSKINESIDMCLKLNIDATKSDQQVRTVVLMPSGTGREVRFVFYHTFNNIYLLSQSFISLFTKGLTYFEFLRLQAVY